MSKFAMGAKMYASLPEWPKFTTAPKVAEEFGVSRRSAQRDLRTLEAAGLAFTDWDGGGDRHHPARWWRA
jgi:predicted DNA-binding transcriptional regulator YafY